MTVFDADQNAFNAWLDQNSAEILSRWYRTGLLYRSPLTDEQVCQVGAKLAQACLSQSRISPDEVNIFWKSHPFSSHALSAGKKADRFAILEQALSCKDFEAWFMGNMPDGRPNMALESWIDAFPNDVRRIEMPKLGGWIAQTWSSQVFKKELFSNQSMEELLSISPKGPETQEAIRNVVMEKRRQALSEIASENNNLRPLLPKSVKKRLM